MGDEKRLYNPFDSTVVTVYLLLVTIGWLSIHATGYDGVFNPLNFSASYGKQIIWIGVSFLLFIAVLGFDRRVLQFFSYPIYGAVILLLMSVFVIGSSTKGDMNWIDLGFFKLQPSEFSKFATALALAKYLDTPQVRFSNFKERMIAFAIVGLPFLLVMAQGDAGTGLVFLGFVFVFNKEGLGDWIIWLGLYVIAISIFALAINKFLLIGLLVVLFALILTYIYVVLPKEKVIVPLAVGAMVLSIGYVLAVDAVFHKVLERHQRDRINVILGKVEDVKGVAYNLNQSKIAIGSGGVFGKGYLQGTQTRYDYVPEISTDFIFCSIGEEWGFIGSVVLITLFVILLQRLIIMAERQRSAYSRVYIYSVAAIFFVHFTINIGMTIGLLPVIGIPLPFISYGGSSMISFSFMLAVAVKLDSERLMSIR